MAGGFLGGAVDMDGSRAAKLVLVHDWLTGMRGGEKCLEALCRHWPDAPLFSLLHKPGSVSPCIEQRPLTTSLLQRLPRVERYYRYLLPLMPAAVESWRLPGADLVVSLSHCVAKAVKPPRGVPHVCYCFTPMRYAWHQRAAYFSSERIGRLKARLVDELLAMLREWDRRTAARVTHFLAISKTVQQRIWDCYQRRSDVIYPPVDTDFYCPAKVPRADYYLAVSAFAPYKRLDLAIEACNRLRRPLRIIGNGQDERRLRRLAGPTVQFLGWQPDELIREQLRRCRALLFPGEEDFGIVPVEAQACGTPVLAFGRGGVTETTLPLGDRKDPTALWFAEQTADCLAAAIETFEAHEHAFTPYAARRQAEQFNQRRFERELFGFLEAVLRPEQRAARRAA
jgi:glycosyltransferase involved in cell wall biosynthesis